ncbi:hypothetical protein BTUL_0203g00050 [Botrytis tulipae]|uniref:Nudix hydrolase domain-containing protein n=1 Tax=Botrytis tulipae TaxID=87230 RepID=A0A4Z1E8N5_9HELO|nr:hypothetical protein BTUL_0203g00050 [Botrytis tulipae]
MIGRLGKPAYGTLLQCSRSSVPALATKSMILSHRHIHMTPSPSLESSSTTPPIPLVGLGVFIIHPTHPLSTRENPMYLLGERINSTAANTWGLPGGHLEFGETFEEGASREVLEETGNLIMKEEKRHFVSIFMVGVWNGKGEGPRVMEKEKCRGWEWVSWEETKKWVEMENAGRKLFPGMGGLIRELKGVAPPS